jgi:CheY-like chemotaxis protein
LYKYLIAVIEDNPTDIMLLRLALDRTGLLYELREISDGKSALQSLADGRPVDVIITDLVVPGMDFEQLLTGLKRTSDVPVVVMSGMRDPKLAQRIKERGAADFLVKPANLDGWWTVGERLKAILENVKGAERGA